MNGHIWDRKANTAKTKKNVGKSAGTQRSKSRKPLPKAHETEEEAIIRRFHDAQRMARFRAKKKKALEEARILKATDLTEVSLVSELRKKNIAFEIANSVICASNPKEFPAHLFTDKASFMIQPTPVQNKYSQLLAVIEKLGKDIRLTYAGSRSSIERLKIGIVQAKMLVKDCLLETTINS